MDLKRYIIEKSKEIGIDLIGFTDAEDFYELSEFLKMRREKNYETEFEEKDIEKRVSPKKLLKTGKTIIVIGVSYYINTYRENIKANSTPKGKISKSALGTDYHIVLKEKMNKLIEQIKKVQSEFNYSIGVDTTPLLDRFLAKRAGVGWYGKNSNIINDKVGSFIFLGYIITDLELEKDESVIEKCEECDVCIKSCPVGAIKKDYELNAKRCISYLTQTKNEIPYDLREKMKNNIYGCDICQEVCPKNKGVLDSNEYLIKEGILEYLEIKEILSMSNSEFKDKYKRFAFSWRGKNVIKRNCIIALGNLGDKKNIDLLKKTLKDPSPMIRKYSAWAILKLDLEEGICILEKHKKSEADNLVNIEIEKLKKYFKISDN